jgi:hypothetical protein
MVCLKLSKVWSCCPEKVLKTSVDLVIDALQYEGFLSEYEETAIVMNREEK